MKTLVKSKAELRKFFSKRRAEYVRSGPRAAGDLSIAEHLQPWLKDLESSNVGRPLTGASYAYYKSEANPMKISSLCPQWEWAYPRIKGNEIDFYAVSEAKSNWELHSYGMMEPIPERGHLVELAKCLLVLVPGVAFDRNGHRLGSGKGFYDRALENYGGVCIGIGFSVQVSSQHLPVEDHDRKMDYLVTENGLTKCA